MTFDITTREYAEMKKSGYRDDIECYRARRKFIERVGDIAGISYIAEANNFILSSALVDVKWSASDEELELIVSYIRSGLI